MHRIAACLTLLLATALVHAGEAQTRNPILDSGPDPWVVRHASGYYYTHTTGDRIELRKTTDIAKLGWAKPIVVWRAPASGPNSTSIWAPELHRLDGKWYLYYSAANKRYDDDAHRRIFVLENASPDPMRGHWTDRGMVNTQRTGIDGTVFDHRGKRYFVYSAYVDDHSDLIIAAMRNPWTLEGPQITLAAPTHAWEMQGGRKILEGPQFLAGPGDKIFLAYSASACWSDDYALGLLTARADADPTDPASWRKSDTPVFAKSTRNGVYAPGHNAFFKAADGSDWIIYHANGGPDWKCTSRRAPHIQRFSWRADGTPDFGTPRKDFGGQAPVGNNTGNKANVRD